MQASTVIPLNLDQMTERASRVLVGTCQSVSEGATAEGVPYTAYAFAVDEVLKGTVGSSVTVRQFGRRSSREANGLMQVFRVQGMPTYREGERVLLFLTAESSIGLTAPVGLFQGAFKLGAGASGDLEAMNGAANVGLFRGMEELPRAASNHRLGAVKLSLIRQLLLERRR